MLSGKLDSDEGPPRTGLFGSWWRSQALVIAVTVVSMLGAGAFDLFFLGPAAWTAKREASSWLLLYFVEAGLSFAMAVRFMSIAKVRRWLIPHGFEPFLLSGLSSMHWPWKHYGFHEAIYLMYCDPELAMFVTAPFVSASCFCLGVFLKKRFNRS
jgi:hypothetical protein